MERSTSFADPAVTLAGYLLPVSFLMVDQE